ncbi:MAG: hypothetical protein IJQ12_00980 [Lachnospiraceae bacterium]|nr:hypothetical protein [Lachnospiraceae bacterium]
MQNGIIRKGVLLIISAIVLVFVIVYATNRDRFGRNTSTGAGQGLTLGEEGQETAYGVQIGNNLKAFLSDESFFDGAAVVEEVPYVEEEGTSLSPKITAEGNVIIIRVTDSAGRMVTGESFSVTMTKTDQNTRTTQLTFVDDDMDGVIRSSTLTDGVWEVILRPLAGYLVPPTGTSVRLGDVTEEDEEESTEEEEQDTHNNEADGGDDPGDVAGDGGPDQETREDNGGDNNRNTDDGEGNGNGTN